MNRLKFLCALLLALMNTLAASGHWVGSWYTAPQLVEAGNMPPSPGLTNNSLRQIFRISLGGDTIRMRFSNEFSTSAVTMLSVRIAISAGGHRIDTTTERTLTFSGSRSVTMEANGAVISDPLAFHLAPRQTVAVTICFGATSTTVTGHPGSRTTSYLLPGNDPDVHDFTTAVTTDHWYAINALDVLASDSAGSIAILGNSITDGRGSTTNAQNRWPDILSERMMNDPQTRSLGVLNAGIGGNCVLRGGLGPVGVNRFERDIIERPGIRYAVVFEGVNDIGGVTTDSLAQSVSAGLIDAYRQFIVRAHEKKVHIYGATIMPFLGNKYYNDASERCRQSVNRWIRTPGNFDGVIDFDLMMRDPRDSLRITSSFQNDGLHPDSLGHRTMGMSVDLLLFDQKGK